MNARRNFSCLSTYPKYSSAKTKLPASLIPRTRPTKCAATARNSWFTSNTCWVCMAFARAYFLLIIEEASQNTTPTLKVRLDWASEVQCCSAWCCNDVHPHAQLWHHKNGAVLYFEIKSACKLSSNAIPAEALLMLRRQERWNVYWLRNPCITALSFSELGDLQF